MRIDPVETMADEDLLALIAGAGPAAATVREKPEAPPGEVRRDRGAAMREALRRMRGGRKARVPALRSSCDAVAALGGSLARRRQECFWAVALDARNRPVSRHLVAVGTLASCIVHPREVFAPLLRRRAAAAILLHNHPSGDETPSGEDQDLTDRLVKAGALLGVPVLDHIIVAKDGYFSFRDAGKIG